MSFLSYLTGTTDPDDQQAAYAAQQAKFEASAQARRDAGTATPEMELIVTDYRQNLSGPLENSDSAAREGFVEGAKEGWQNVLAAPGDAIKGLGGTIGTVLKNVPWWFYGVVVLAGLIYTGAAAPLMLRAKGIFKK